MSKRKLPTIVVSLVLILMIVSISGCTSDTSSTEEAKTTTETTSTQSPTPAGISNPAKVREPVSVKIRSYDDTKTVEVTVVDYIRGEKANAMIKDANMFNDDPKPGHEYLLVKVRVKYTEGSETLSVNPLDFRVVIDGAMHDYEWVVLPEETPKLDSVDLLPGGKVEGWLAFMVPENQKVLIAYQENMFDDPLAYIEIPER
ncbi:hypothetical protein TEU_07705 [Thermococcus eurythermalis]|uniref:DUF4352 domain-containing protein n=1 Tax=Thermococcus eurythermalis TaxID=1505907 RepID=A0A097QUS3_9EURY|nr:DUF4352 domain-containing protein [Thermococcus eurythermalis]AIU70226.1 hypothetical protein TEU_07705 [Thermococcus eurythermalis]